MSNHPIAGKFKPFTPGEAVADIEDIAGSVDPTAGEGVQFVQVGRTLTIHSDVTQLATVADLRAALVAGTKAKVVHVANHTSSTDTGGGVFDIVSIGAHVNDPLGGVCVTGGTLAALRRLERRNSVLIDWWGASHVSTDTKDQDAFDAARAYVDTLAGGGDMIATGHYYVHSVNLTCNAGGKKIALLGEGDATIEQKFSITAHPVVDISDSFSVTVANVTVLSQAWSRVGVLLCRGTVVGSCNTILLDNVSISGTYLFTALAGIGCEIVRAENCKIQNLGGGPGTYGAVYWSSKNALGLTDGATYAGSTLLRAATPPRDDTRVVLTGKGQLIYCAGSMAVDDGTDGGDGYGTWRPDSIAANEPGRYIVTNNDYGGAPLGVASAYASLGTGHMSTLGNKMIGGYRNTGVSATHTARALTIYGNVEFSSDSQSYSTDNATPIVHWYLDSDIGANSKIEINDYLEGVGPIVHCRSYAATQANTYYSAIEVTRCNKTSSGDWWYDEDATIVHTGLVFEKNTGEGDLHLGIVALSRIDACAIDSSPSASSVVTAAYAPGTSFVVRAGSLTVAAPLGGYAVVELDVDPKIQGDGAPWGVYRQRFGGATGLLPQDMPCAAEPNSHQTAAGTGIHATADGTTWTPCCPGATASYPVTLGSDAAWHAGAVVTATGVQATSAGVPGTFALSGGALWFCVASGNWKAVTLG